MTRIKRILFTIMTSLGLLMPAAVPALAGAVSVPDTEPNDTRGGLCAGAELQVGADCASVDAGSDEDINALIETVINIFSLIVGIVAVIMIIVAGLKYITSGGDSGNVTGAKNTILYAVIGLIIVALAQVIVRFVLNQTTDLAG
jgi:hypothetical protein